MSYLDARPAQQLRDRMVQFSVHAMHKFTMICRGTYRVRFPAATDMKLEISPVAEKEVYQVAWSAISPVMELFFVAAVLCIARVSGLWSERSKLDFLGRRLGGSDLHHIERQLNRVIK